MKKTITDERVRGEGSTCEAAVRTQRTGRETRTRHGQRGFHGGGTGLAHQFPRSSGAQAHTRPHVHEGGALVFRERLIGQPGFSVSSELSTGPVRPCLSLLDVLRSCATLSLSLLVLVLLSIVRTIDDMCVASP